MRISAATNQEGEEAMAIGVSLMVSDQIMFQHLMLTLDSSNLKKYIGLAPFSSPLAFNYLALYLILVNSTPMSYLIK